MTLTRETTNTYYGNTNGWGDWNTARKTAEAIGIVPGHGWLDHARYITTEDGRRIYESHPYHLDTDSFVSITEFEKYGWKIYLDGYSSYYGKGAIRVQITRLPEEERLRMAEVDLERASTDKSRASLYRKRAQILKLKMS